MTTIAEFTLDGDSFPLGVVFADLGDVEIELERVVPTNQAFVPYFWIRGTAADEVEAVIEPHAALTSLEIVDTVGSGVLVRAEWDASYEGVVAAIAESELVLIQAVGRHDQWRFELRAPDRDELSAFQEYCRDHDLPVRLERLYGVSEVNEPVGYGLTDAQRKALQLAYERGYYDEDRQRTLDEIASELDITRQSLASRLRRGTANLVASTIGGLDEP